MKVTERRDRLVAAAFAVIARDGAAAASTRAICAEAKMPQSAFHYAFESKDELFRELSRTVVATQTIEVSPTTVQTLSFAEAITHALHHAFDAAAGDPARQLVLIELTVRDLQDPVDPGALNRWQFEHYVAVARDLLIALAREYNKTWAVPLDALARVVAMSLSGATLAWLGDRDPARAHASLDVLRVMIAGAAV